MVNKGKVAIWCLSITLIVSILINGLLFMSFVGIVMINEEEFVLNDIEWCEVNNEWIDLANDLIYELEYYNSEYSYEDLYTEPVNCWERDDYGAKVN